VSRDAEGRGANRRATTARPGTPASPEPDQ